MVLVAIPVLVAFFLVVNRHYRIGRAPAARGCRRGPRSAPAKNTTSSTSRRSTPRRSSPPGTRGESPAASTTRNWSHGAGGPTRAATGGTSAAASRSRASGGRTRGGRPGLHLGAAPQRVAFVTVVVPETFERPRSRGAVTAANDLRLKLRLLREPGIVVTDVRLGAATGQPPGARAAGCSCRRPCRVAARDQVRADARPRTRGPCSSPSTRRRREHARDLEPRGDRRPARHRPAGTAISANRSAPTCAT